MRKHPFDKIDLIAFAAGDVLGDRRAALERHIASCEPCRRFATSLASEKASFLASHPYERTVALPAQPQAAQRFTFFRSQVYALAATLLLFAGAGFLYLSHTATPGIRTKGDTALKIFVKNRQGAVERRDGNEYSTGEKVQFLYSCGNDNNFALISIDTTGGITTYFPASGDSSMVLERGRDIPLPNSIALDNYTGPEVFAGVFSSRRFSLTDLRRLIAASLDKSGLSDSLRLRGDGFVVVSHLLTIKQANPR
jgi:hypothetical protein